MSERLFRVKTVLWGLVGVLASVTAVRFIHGLGAVTHLSDAAPWGLWIGFDVMSGVALAAGGFVLAATVYIFGLERYRPFVRAAVLTALLGYAAVAVGLLYDLGLPWRIWHPLVHWQHHSVLFEVAMCVMLYLTVLALEFAPVVLEHPLFSGRIFKAVLRFLEKATIPLVITGIVLSTLHQSSLGSLFLITPYRVHPLWYSPIIYVLFFVSAVGLGLMMVTLESLVSSWLVGHKLHMREIGGLGLAASVVLWIYLALRLGDLAMRGVLPQAWDGSRPAALFLFEVGVSAALPATLLLFRRVRASVGAVALCSVLTVAGMVLYRLDVSVVAFARPQDFGYVPSWEELAVSVGIVAAFLLIFLFFVEHLRVYDDVGPSRRDGAEDGAGPDLSPPAGRSFDPATLHGLLPGRLAAPRRYSAAVVSGAVVALAFLPVKGKEAVPVPVAAARSVEGTVLDRGVGAERILSFADEGGGGLAEDLDEASDVHPVVGGDLGPDPGHAPGPGRDPDSRAAPLLLIDGNRSGPMVLFDHEAHVERLGADSSCVTCHHMSLPLERNTACTACHRDMYDTTSVFEHATHVEALDGNAGCVECHDGSSPVKSYETATACAACHQGEVHVSAIIEAPHERWRAAAGYTDAMHGLCLECHRRLMRDEPDEHPAGMDQCRACHDADRPEQLRRLTPSRSHGPATGAGPGVTRAGGGGAP